MNSVLQAFLAMKPRPADAELAANPVFREKIARQIVDYPSLALPSAQAATAICGIIPNGAGAAEVWMVTGEGFERTLRAVIAQHRLVLEMSKEIFNLHRMHMLIDPARHGAGRYAESVGFEFEVALRRMGAMGQDLHVYLYEGRK